MSRISLAWAAVCKTACNLRGPIPRRDSIGSWSSGQGSTPLRCGCAFDSRRADEVFPAYEANTAMMPGSVRYRRWLSRRVAAGNCTDAPYLRR
jgi:hypothetical protein